MKLFIAVTWAAFVLCGAAPRLAAENWAQWRGPALNGSTTETNLPGEGINSNQVIWSAALPGPGAATPVVWGNRVYVNSGDKDSFEVVALGINAQDGSVAWRQVLSLNHKSSMNNDMASPSSVTDGEHVWLLTGNGALGAFTKDGQPMWKRDLAKDYGAFVVNFGYSSSPLLYEGRLYVLVLRNEKPPGGALNQNPAAPVDSYLLALDPQTGRTLWRQARDTDATDQSRESYNTPYPLDWNGRREIVLAGGECVTGHDPVSGAELWRWWYSPTNRGITQHVVPTPVAEDGLIYVVRAEHRPLFALHAGESGLVGDEAVAWTFEQNKGWISSPLLYRGRLYVPQEEEGAVVCLDPKTGRVIWTHKISAKGRMQTSPTGADGKIYLLSLFGELEVLSAGDESRELGILKLDDSLWCRSTVVAANGKLFARTMTRLYCLGVTSKATEEHR